MLPTEARLIARGQKRRLDCNITLPNETNNVLYAANYFNGAESEKEMLYFLKWYARAKIALQVFNLDWTGLCGENFVLHFEFLLHQKGIWWCCLRTYELKFKLRQKFKVRYPGVKITHRIQTSGGSRISRGRGDINLLFGKISLKTAWK